MQEESELKKMIYAIKNGRKTGIFNEWLKCSEQTNKYDRERNPGGVRRTE